MTDLTIDPKKTALVAVDLQKWIVSFETKPHPAAQVISKTRLLADALREAGGFIVWVRVSASPDGGDMLKPLCDQPMAWRGERPKDWAELSPDLGARASDHVVTKKQWGAFYGTDLDLQLRRRGITTLILTGIATCFGVESTARDAYERGCRQIFAEDAMSSLDAEEHRHTISRVFPRIGQIRKADEIARALRREEKTAVP
jgi:nicotinamidase-related amidase